MTARSPARALGSASAGRVATRRREAPMDAAWRDAGRWLLTSGAFFLPQPRRKAIDRWLRGREEHRKLAARRLRPDVLGQERAHLAARHAVALLPDRLRHPRRPHARVRQPQARQSGDPERVLHPRQLPAQLHRQLDRQVRVLRQEDRDAGARPARHRRLPVLPVEIPDAAGQEDAERLSGAWRRGADLRFRDEPGRRPARDHRLPRDVAARAAAGAGFDRGPLRGHAGRPRAGAAARAGVPRHARRRCARSGTRSPTPPTTT